MPGPGGGEILTAVRPSLAAAYFIVLGVMATTAPLAFRRRYPASVFCVIIAAVLATNGHSTAVTFAAVLFAAYSAIVYSPHRRLALLCVGAAAVIVTAAFPSTTPPVPARFTALLVMLPTAAVAMAMRTWRRRAGDSAERLRQAQAEHEAQTLRAVEAERARIASELHDVVTHNVSVMVVQAGAARRVLGSSPEQARDALLAVEASGRTAMGELRHLLGLLAPAVPGQQAPGEQDAALVPQPGLGQVPALVDRVRAAGLPAELVIDGARALPPGVDLAAYRVVQEALTNVIKHAAGARAVIRLVYSERELVITVTDDGAPERPALRARGGGRTRADRAAGAARPVRRRARRGPAAGRRLAGAGLPPARTRAGIPGHVSEDGGAPRVVIADDQTLVRGGFRLILGSAGIPVVAEAADGREAIAATLRHRPDVVLMDIRMPEMDGLEATRRIAAARSDVRIIILTTFDLDQYVYAALAAGASGFLLKDVSPEHLIAAVRLVRCGDALLAPSITRRLVERFAPRSPDPAGPGLSALTPRELEVLGLIARGLSNAELAAALTLSEATVKTHVARILGKLGLRDRVQAVVLAYETGLVSPGSTGPGSAGPSSAGAGSVS